MHKQNIGWHKKTWHMGNYRQTDCKI